MKNLKIITLAVCLATIPTTYLIAEDSSEHAVHQAQINADRAEAKIKKIEKKEAIDREINGVFSPEVRRDQQEITAEQRKLREAQDAVIRAERGE